MFLSPASPAICTASYAETVPDMKIAGWLHAYSYFVGVIRILTLDNVKTAIIKNTRTELSLNGSTQEMAEHYGTGIVFARPAALNGKASVLRVRVRSTFCQRGLWQRCAMISSFLFKNGMRLSA